MIYLASPYSHPDPAVRQQRFESACEFTASMMRAGRLVFSPVVHSHPLVAYGLPTDWSYWRRLDLDHLRRCESLMVLTLDGWETSVGVASEIDAAIAMGKPVAYVAI